VRRENDDALIVTLKVAAKAEQENLALWDIPRQRQPGSGRWYLFQRHISPAFTVGSSQHSANVQEGAASSASARG